MVYLADLAPSSLPTRKFYFLASNTTENHDGEDGLTLWFSFAIKDALVHALSHTWRNPDPKRAKAGGAHPVTDQAPTSSPQAFFTPFLFKEEVNIVYNLQIVRKSLWEGKRTKQQKPLLCPCPSLQYAPPQRRISDPIFSFPDGCLNLSK